jgi:hypothetical protein
MCCALAGARQASTLKAKSSVLSAASSSAPTRADSAAAQAGVVTTALPMAIASSTLFWMPRATRSGATTAAACRR